MLSTTNATFSHNRPSWGFSLNGKWLESFEKSGNCCAVTRDDEYRNHSNIIQLKFFETLTGSWTGSSCSGPNLGLHGCVVFQQEGSWSESLVECMCGFLPACRNMRVLNWPLEWVWRCTFVSVLAPAKNWWCIQDLPWFLSNGSWDGLQLPEPDEAGVENRWMIRIYVSKHLTKSLKRP